ncbi:MAG: type II toxin-antitoxin system HicA family toxin [Methanocorpusculum sp.]|nr:type II toxin-antitoxin system HicA family toxin [Methanocorpusculum sp.]
MPVFKQDKVMSVLRKKGFREFTGDHIKYYFYHNEQKTSIYTFVSHGKQDITRSLLKYMAEQSGLTRDEFIAMLECTVNHDELVKIYQERGLLEESVES